MKLKTDYTKIRKSFEEKFYYLCEQLYPNLKFSKVDRKGYVTITESESIFLFRKRIKKHITEILQRDITAAISVKFFGSLDLVGFYNRKIVETFSGYELDNIARAIDAMYHEFKNRELTGKSSKLEIHDGISNPMRKAFVDDIEAEEPQNEPIGLAYFFDFVFRPTNLRQNVKKYLLATTLVSRMTLSNGSRLSELSFIYNRCMRDPPTYISQVYNTS